MICFHFIIFEPSETTKNGFLLLNMGCDLLSFHYLWAIRNNCKRAVYVQRGVVICFHFIIFEPSETTNKYLLCTNILLWFAFISLSLSHQKQQYFQYLYQFYVVICFHFIIFEPSETTAVIKMAVNGLLWFAFISLSLSHQKQRIITIFVMPLSCDLLSFHYLWAIRNNFLVSG